MTYAAVILSEVKNLAYRRRRPLTSFGVTRELVFLRTLSARTARHE